MICTMCSHGVNRVDMWQCPCGAWHCRHIWECDDCGTHRVNRTMTLAEAGKKHCTLCNQFAGRENSVITIAEWVLQPIDDSRTREANPCIVILCRSCYKKVSLEQRKAANYKECADESRA